MLMHVSEHARPQAAVEEFASEGAVKVYVGKRGAAKAYTQAEIDALLVQHCLQVCDHMHCCIEPLRHPQPSQPPYRCMSSATCINPPLLPQLLVFRSSLALVLVTIVSAWMHRERRWRA